MYLREAAKTLAHQFVGLLARFRKELHFLCDFRQGYNAAKKRSAAETRRTAIHEAGHAAVLIALGLALGGVSIIPDVREGTLGQVYWSQADVSADLRAGEAAYLRYAMVYYAGAEAIRQLIPTDPDPDAGASSDERYADKVIRHHIGGDTRSKDLLFSLARRRCALLVEHYQPEIQALAGALEAELILSGKAARSVFMRSLTERGGRPLTFTSALIVQFPRASRRLH